MRFIKHIETNVLKDSNYLKVCALVLEISISYYE